MAALLLTVLVSLSPSMPDGEPTAVPPIRGLMLLGGEFHHYEANSAILAEALAPRGIQVDRIRIDHPPDGRPLAEAATLPSRPQLLESREELHQYDLIIAYTQEMYLELNEAQQQGVLQFVASGRGWVGIHCAADTWKECDEYITMVGGKFESHPPFSEYLVQRVQGAHPVLDGIDDFKVQDEFYHLADTSLADKQLLLVGTSPGDGKTRPIAWTKNHGAGRVFYTILGHGPETFAHPRFQQLISQAAHWVVGREPKEEQNR